MGGMKHKSDYYDDWIFAVDMWEKYRYNLPDDFFRTKRLDSWNLVRLPLFCHPSDYEMWFNASRGVHRNTYAVCYLIAKNDVIPIKIDKEPQVLIKDPDDMKRVISEHQDIINVALRIVRDYWKPFYYHWDKCEYDDIIIDHFYEWSDGGWKYDPNFLEKHPPSVPKYEIKSAKTYRELVKGLDRSDEIEYNFEEEVM